MSEAQLPLAKAPESKFTEFIPFGGQDKIKLSIEMVKNLIAVKTATGKTCSDVDAIRFVALCQAKRLNPFEQDAFLIGYDGKDGPKFTLVTAHQAFLKRAELHQEYNGMKSGLILMREDKLMDTEGDFYLEGDDVLGAWATVFFKTRENSMHKRVRMKTFNKGFGRWKEDPAGMIVKCAEADALRSSFPTMLGGLYLREEQSELAVDPKITRPIFKKTEKPTVDVAPAEVPPEQTIMWQIFDLLKKENITEETMLEFLGAVGLADEEKSIADLSDETKAMIIEQFADFSARIKEAV